MSTPAATTAYDDNDTETSLGDLNIRVGSQAGWDFDVSRVVRSAKKMTLYRHHVFIVM